MVLEGSNMSLPFSESGTVMINSSISEGSGEDLVVRY